MPEEESRAGAFCRCDPRQAWSRKHRRGTLLVTSCLTSAPQSTAVSAAERAQVSMLPDFIQRKACTTHHKSLCYLRRSGNGLNRHRFAGYAALHRCSLTSEFAQVSLVTIERVNLRPYDQCVIHAFLHAFSGTLSRAFVLSHVVSAAHGVADCSG